MSLGLVRRTTVVLVLAVACWSAGQAFASTVPAPPAAPSSPAGGTVDPTVSAGIVELSDAQLVELGDDVGVLVGIVASATAGDTAAADAVTARIEELGFNTEVVEDGEDAIQQQAGVESFLDAEVDGIVVIGPVGEEFDTSVARALEEGILLVHVVGPDVEGAAPVTVRMPDESEPSAAAAGPLAANAFALWLAGGTAPGTIDVPAPVAESTGSQPTAAPPGEGDALMPATPCGTDLQDAQDLVQETGVFLSQSEDATGEGRMQVIDSNWTVVAQRPEPGTPIAEGDAVFLVVPDDEFEGC